MLINELIETVHENAVKHGWWETDRSINESIVLIHSEWSEAIEEARAGRPLVWHNCSEGDGVVNNPCNPADKTDCLKYGKEAECPYRSAKPEGIAVELIDGVIRILDLYGKYGITFTRNTAQQIIRATEQANPLLNKDTPLVEIVARAHSLTAEAGVRMKAGKAPHMALSPLEACAGLVMWWVQAQGENPEKILQEKHEYNKTRPWKHNKVF